MYAYLCVVVGWLGWLINCGMLDLNRWERGLIVRTMKKHCIHWFMILCQGVEREGSAPCFAYKYIHIYIQRHALGLAHRRAAPSSDLQHNSTHAHT